MLINCLPHDIEYLIISKLNYKCHTCNVNIDNYEKLMKINNIIKNLN